MNEQNQPTADAVPTQQAMVPVVCVSEPPPESSVHAQRDHWRATAQAAWQRVAELEYLLRVERGLRHVPLIKATEDVL